VATVDPTSGVVTIVGVGTAQMTATKAADGRYTHGSAGAEHCESQSVGVRASR
jgi:hypothetical protein